MEYRLVLNEDIEVLANIDPSEVMQLTWALERSTIIDNEGELWKTGDSPTLYFDVHDSYFYLSLEKEE